MTIGGSLSELLFDPIEPYESGMLPVGDGHEIYWEASGNPYGKPAVFLHGGPGGGSSPITRQYFDPQKYRIIIYDQRGCGFSTPHAAKDIRALDKMSTWDLVADLEALRIHLGISSWLVLGGSWGSALALAYAQTHPESVSELILRGVFTLRQREIDWFYRGGAANMAPDAWSSFCEPLVGAHADPVAEYHDLLWSQDPDVAFRAGHAWTKWEANTVYLEPTPDSMASAENPDYALAFARIENHFFVNNGWFEEGQLLADIDRIRHIPAVIVQGRYDLCTPMTTAHELHLAWPEADYRVVMSGHSGFEPAIAAELVAATNRFAS